jgi:hypothetical protein
VSSVQLFWVAISDGDDANSRVRGTVPGEQGNGGCSLRVSSISILGMKELVHMLARRIGSAGVIVGRFEDHCPVQVTAAVAVVSQWRPGIRRYCLGDTTRSRTLIT